MFPDFLCSKINSEIFNYLEGDSTSLEIESLSNLAIKNKLGVHKHSGYWQPVDTIRDLARLEEAIAAKRLPWV